MPKTNSPLDTIEIPLSKTKLVYLLIGAALLITGGAFLINHPGILGGSLVVKIIEYTAVILFSICALFIVNKLFDPSPGFVIDYNGVVDNSSAFAVGFIPWEDFAGMTVQQIGGQKFISIKVIDPDGYIHRRPNALARQAASINYRLYGSPVNVTTSTLNCSFDDLMGQINEQWRQHSAQ
jgi:hypothetical protein